MIKHTFLDKCNTILKDSDLNTGLNPVIEINAGSRTSRALIHFDLSVLEQMYRDNEINLNETRHILKMKNCGAVELPKLNDSIIYGCDTKERASSFDLIFFRLPYEWDNGRGYDYQHDFFVGSHRKDSTEGSSWYKYVNGLEWDEEGVYSNSTLARDYYENFSSDNKGIVITRQHFDYGIEDMEVDLTEYVNNCLMGKEPNNGIGIAFSPRYEKGSSYMALTYVPEDANETNTLKLAEVPVKENKKYLYVECDGVYYKWFDIRKGDTFISFFGHHTNTFFNPYLETVYDDFIDDDRAKFYLGKTNRLYFFTGEAGEAFNLDYMPTCTVNGVEYDVKQAGKGVYYAEIRLDANEVEAESIQYDLWSNLSVNGEIMEDVELEFVVNDRKNILTLGKHRQKGNDIIPSIYGINDSEKLKIGEVREVYVDFIEEYSMGKKFLPAKAEYRIYVKENDREIDVFQYQPVECRYTDYMFVVDTNDLIPNEYHVDIRIKQDRNIKHYENVLTFIVSDNVTNYYM